MRKNLQLYIRLLNEANTIVINRLQTQTTWLQRIIDMQKGQRSYQKTITRVTYNDNKDINRII